MFRTMTKSEEQKTIETLNAKLTAAAKRTVDYFEENLQIDGSFGSEAKDIACYFKTPMMFVTANKPQEAKAVLKHIRAAFMTDEGDFQNNEALKSANGAYIEFWSYTNGWIVKAANQLGVVDISEPANAYLKQYNLGQEAGFSTNKIGKQPVITDVLTVSHHGLINLEMGNQEIAMAAGHYLCQAIAKQPNLKQGFYLRLDKEGELITIFDEGQVPFYFVSTTEPNQLHFMIGYPAAYLAILYKKTRNREFLIAAERYLNFSLSCDKSVYACDFSHKIAWAASLIYECTGNSKYLLVIDRIANHFIAKQQASGMWFSEDINSSYDQSAEIACWFLDIVKNINALKKKHEQEASQSAAGKSRAWNKGAIAAAVFVLAGIGLAIWKVKTATPSSAAAIVDAVKPSSGMK